MEELHVTVIAPVELLKHEYAAMQRALRSKRFDASLHDAVREVFRRYRSFQKARFRVSR